MALPGIRAAFVMAPALLSAARWWRRLHPLGLRAVLDLHRDGLRPRWVLRMLFLLRHRYLERAAGRAARREQREWTAARCWPITWSLPRPQWVAVQTKPEPAPDIVALALALRWTWAHPPRRHTPAARDRMLGQLSLLSPAPKLEYPRTAVQVRWRCHPAAARNQGWAARVGAPQFRAEMVPAAASAETRRAAQRPELDTALILPPTAEFLPRTVPVAQAILQRAIPQFEASRLVVAAVSSRSPDLVPTQAPTTRARRIAAPANNHKHSMS